MFYSAQWTLSDKKTFSLLFEFGAPLNFSSGNLEYIPMSVGSPALMFSFRPDCHGFFQTKNTFILTF